MIEVHGSLFATAADLAAQLGVDVTPGLLRDWKRRGLITAHRVGRVNFYPLHEVIEAEATTRDRTKRRRAA